MLGCSSAPDPEPSPTPAFASEEEAFAAAEETYRAYNDAGNAAEDASRFLTGAALDSDVETNRLLEQRNLVMSGPSTVTSFRGTEAAWSARIATIEAEICLDVSRSRVLDAHGADVTPLDRSDTWLLLVTFIGTTEKLLILDSTPTSDRSC